GEELLTPTRIYVSTVHVILRDFKVLGLAHITGGGLLENVPRILPRGVQAVINKNTWDRPEIFEFLENAGQLEEEEMYRTFNMGVGLVLVVQREQSGEILDRLHGMGEKAFLIGETAARRKNQPAVKLV
ncbi:MAG: AIR synthase-related protein, partial [Thermodesulfobacteriota bacterium]